MGDFRIEPVYSPEVYVVGQTTFARDLSESPWALWYSTVEEASDAELLTEFAGRMCYQSWSRPNPKTATNPQYIENLLRHRHFSVFEHASVSVALCGISRAVSHELVRHRHFSFSQLSQRFVGPSTIDDDGVDVWRVVVHPRIQRMGAVEELLSTVESAVLSYYRLLEAAKKADSNASRKQLREAARSVLPNCIETRMVMTGNHRAWYEFFEKRLNPAADEEMQVVARRIHLALYNVFPALYKHVRLEY